MKEFQNLQTTIYRLQNTANQTYIEFAREKEQFFDRWCHSEKINGSYDHLTQLLLLEKFKNNCASNDLKIYPNDRNVDTLCLACHCTDKYTIMHKDTNIKTSSIFNIQK